MKKTSRTLKINWLILSVVFPLMAVGQEPAAHAPTGDLEKKAPVTQPGQPRLQEVESKYDLFADKLEKWVSSSQDAAPSTILNGDEITANLSHFQLRSAAESIRKLETYRNAVEKQCKGIDDSATLLVQALDACLINDVLYPAVSKSKLEQNEYQIKISKKALVACKSELGAYFKEKEKRTDLTEKDLFTHDLAAAESLAYVFESFGGKSLETDSAIAENSELIKTLKKVKASDLCQVKLDTQEKKDTAGKSDAKKEASQPASSHGKQSRSEYEESVEESIEEEEIYQPLAPKKIAEDKPVYTPAPKPAPAPAPAPQPKPTYQPAPYQPTPYKPRRYEQPAPAPKNNVPFIPAPRPTPRRAVVGGPPPIAPVPIARGPFGLSLGFGTYSSTVTAPIVPPPMPYPPMMPPMMPMPMGGGMMGGGLTGVSSAPRACLVCSTAAPMPMPTLGLGNMLARPCMVRTPTGIVQQPIGACLPNMPTVGVGNMPPNWTQIPRFPGQPVNPGTGTPNQPAVVGGRIPPTRTTVPRTVPNSTLLRKRVRR